MTLVTSSWQLVNWSESWQLLTRNWSHVTWNLTWSCRPGVTVFLVKVVFLKPCRGTSRCTSSQARGPSHRTGHVPVIWSRTCSKPDLELSFRHYCFGAAAVRRCPYAPTVCDWGPQQAGPDKGHSNNFKCSTSGLEVFSCYAAAMMFAMR